MNARFTLHCRLGGTSRLSGSGATRGARRSGASGFGSYRWKKERERAMSTPTERRRRIVKDIEVLGDDVVPRLSRKYGVSEMTIRRDLKVLESTG